MKYIELAETGTILNSGSLELENNGIRSRMLNKITQNFNLFSLFPLIKKKYTKYINPPDVRYNVACSLT